MKSIMLVKTKKITLIVICLITFNFPIVAQEMVTEKSITITAEQTQLLQKNEESIKKWIDDLQTPGVVITDGNQMTFSKEALRLINEPNYLDEVYKDTYTFVDIKESLMKGEYIKAIWKMLTIYPENKENVLKYIYAFDKVIPSDKLVVNAFYTYAFFDPKITTIENGKPNIYRPDVFEDYLRRTKEIVAYITYFRAQEVNDVKKE
ncbi:MAG: hypothetical protein GQ540_06940 [Lutibacter sp.]|uniref:hypothetical protein n=1 Tax=Lutibacter sp. TaxID=1925666 RepID=UPI0019E92E15|nr:hypothetical protein [Lutibacter sp.]NOR28248.1 hypothetical protein [Lutibacter sp.]